MKVGVRVLLVLFLLASFLVPLLPASPAKAAPADAYWVGGTGLWSDAANHWAAASGAAPNAINLPDATTNVHFDANSFGGAGQSVTIDATADCLDMDWTGATNTPTLAGSAVLRIKGSLTLIAAMATTYSGSLYYTSTAAGRTITTAGQTLASHNYFSGVGGEWTLQDNYTTTGYFRHQRGTIVTNDKTVTVDLFESVGGNARTLTLGASTINVATNGFEVDAVNLTITANTATINTLSLYCMLGDANYNGASFNLNGTAHIVSGAATGIASFARNGTATKTDSVTFTSGTTLTSTNVTFSGNSVTNRLLVQSTTLGTAATLTATNWVNTDNVDFMDITSTNAIDLSALATVGDAGGNTGITFTPSAAQTWDGTTGSWSNAAKWTSRVPLPQDDVSAGGAGNTITVDMPRIGKGITITGTPTVSLSNAIASYGSLTTPAGATWTSGGNIHYQRSRGTFAINRLASGSHPMTITNSNTFTTFHISAASGVQTVTFTDGTTQTINDFTRDAGGTNVITLTGTAAAGWNITKSDGTDILLDYLSVTNSTALPVTTFYAGTHSTNGGGNTNWTFDGAALTVTTNAATGVTMDKDGVTGGSFNGTISDKAGTPYLLTNFEYGTTIAYGSATANVSKYAYGTYTASIPAALTPSATYHFRADTNAGTVLSSGADGTFTLTMPTPITGAATNVAYGATSTATLNGSTSSMGAASSTYGAWEWGYDVAYGNVVGTQVIAGVTSVSQVITGFDPTRTVHFRFRVQNGATYSYGADQTFILAGSSASSSPTFASFNLANSIFPILLAIVVIAALLAVIFSDLSVLVIPLVIAAIVYIGISALQGLASLFRSMW